MPHRATFLILNAIWHFLSSSFMKWIFFFFFGKIQKMNLKVMVVGDCNVGKTSLIYRYTKQKMPSDNALRFDNYKKCLNVDGEIFNLQIWDSNGHEVLLRLLSYSHTDVFLICFSIVDPTSFINVNDEWLVEIHKRMKNPVIILVGTKSDLRNDEATLQALTQNGQKAVTPEEAKAKAAEIKAVDYLECSAMTQEGVKQVFDLAISTAMAPKKKKACNLI